MTPDAIAGAGASAASTSAERAPDTIAVQGPAEPAEDQQRTAPASQNRLVEEVVVTSQKREENLQDVPISISAFSAAALDAKGIDDPKALAQSTPGVYYGQTVNFAIIYIRGVGSDAFLPDSDPSVASYIDGIYFPFANGLSQSFGAVERVEVLKGPQGTLFGRNSTGGAFNTITKTPGTEPEVSVMASYADYNEIRRRVYVSLPFGDSFAASVSATYNTSDNYYTGTRGSGVDASSVELPEEVSKGVRIKTRWNMTDNMDLNLAAFRYRQDGLSSTAIPNTNPSLATTLISDATTGGQATRPLGTYEVHVDVPSYFSVDNKVYYGQLNYHPEWFDVKLLGSKQKIASDNVYDFDGTTAPFITFDAKGQFADVKTAEMQFLSNKDWGPEWWTWIFGGFYLDQESGFPLNRLSVGSLDLSDGNIAGIIPVPPALLDLLSQIPGVPDGVSVGLVSELSTKSTAFFTQHTFDLQKWLHLTVGGRYQRENRGVVESSASLVNLDGSTTPLHTVPAAPPPSKTTNFSPKFTIGVNPMDDLMVYTSYTKGYKSGTFNTVNVYNAPEYVKPETVTSIELGFKSELFDKLLRFNAAVFQNKIDDLQVQFISLLSGGAVSLENAGGAKINGAEFDFQLTPFPEWDPGLVIGGGYTYLDSKYTSYENGSGYTVNANGDYAGAGLYNFKSGDYTGNKVTRTPKLSGTFNINQIVDVPGGDLEMGASLYNNSGFFYLADNAPVSRQKSYYVIDAQISYLYKPANTRVTLFGKNLGDEVYSYSQFHTDAGRQTYLAPPRTFGIRLNWDL
ncbi:TonB-dependent receptor [Hydrocarboniphaga sp.]|uniref:TonB-dependent receptor n=1 Tax=Hydrocarboniphaga sp. TaxID=2033016 RepID=UPI002629DA31|nr:TonB-dependent receptor [Hydrocarboniphaga sp.]